VAASAGGATRNKAESNIVAAPVPTVAPGITGIATITSAQALAWFRDPQYQQELIVFVDARDSKHYEQGHIPGAFEFDRYYPEKHLFTVLPALNRT
jgi:hypothetical protein